MPTEDQEPENFTQTLRIEINGSHPLFKGNHTPGICAELRRIADALETHGVQLMQYPIEVMDSKEWVARLDLIEETIADETTP